MTASTLADACPSLPCVRGNASASLPLATGDDVNGSVRADYRCAACGHEWSTWWDARTAGRSDAA